MNDVVVAVSPYSGKTFRLKVTDCHGNYLTSEDVTSIQYSVLLLDMGARLEVGGHTAISVPSTALLAEPVASVDTGNVYNFDYRISGAEVLPFAEVGMYLVVFTFFVGNEPYSCTIRCLSE